MIKAQNQFQVIKILILVLIYMMQLKKTNFQIKISIKFILKLSKMQKIKRMTYLNVKIIILILKI